MKLSKEALSKIFNTFRGVHQNKDKVEPSAGWQSRVMDDIRQQPPPAGRCFRPVLWGTLFVLFIGLLCLYFLMR
ncbi:MAG: hypothetical protein M0P70_00615 [Desulfobulbaceae bacterium]|nr:hypothetical protein [Desulfobulbaceae bacterium]